MVEGKPDEGILPSGQVAAAIGKLESCEDLIHGIAAEAEASLAALYGRLGASCAADGSKDIQAVA